MNIYIQKSGEWYLDGNLLGTGYSGAMPDGKNNPTMENVKFVGPIPQGSYTIEGPPFNDPKHGPYCLRLTPDSDNVMYGRDGFLCHGDNMEHPGCASEGCIIQQRVVREAIWNSNDDRLEVI